MNPDNLIIYLCGIVAAVGVAMMWFSTTNPQPLDTTRYITSCEYGDGYVTGTSTGDPRRDGKVTLRHSSLGEISVVGGTCMWVEEK